MSRGGSHYVSFVFCPFIHCEDALEHHQSKSSSSMPSSWTMNLTARGGRSFRVWAEGGDLLSVCEHPSAE